MPATVVLIATTLIFLLAYRYYSPYLANRVFGLDASITTPAHRFSDGVDFVPTNRHIVFSHHFISVAGAAPIVGPATAVFWGWGPALAWVVLGTVFAAGVHDRSEERRVGKEGRARVAGEQKTAYEMAT